MEKPKIVLQYSNKEPESSIIMNTPLAVLKEKKVYGDYDGKGWVNKLIFGDNLPVLQALCQDPEIKGNVRLIYIDPPFGTGKVYDEREDLTRYDRKVYEDTLVSYEYLEFLRKRLILMKELLAEDGSIYLHLDRRMAHYLKVLMDEIFGARNFRSWITRKKCHPKGYTKKTFGNIQDFILFYSKRGTPVWNKPLKRLTEEKIKGSEYRYVEESTSRIYKKVPLHAPGVRHGATGQPWKGRKPLKGKHWQYPPKKLEEFDRQGRIYWSPTGNPRLKVYLNERKGVLMQDIWLEYLDPMNQFTSVTRYPTEKNQAMLEKIVETSSNKGDIVMDAFMGSGTTLVAAEKLNRKWIGIDNGGVAIKTCVRRLQNLSKKDKIRLTPFRLYAIQGLRA